MEQGMMEEAEIEMLLTEIPRATASPCLPQNQQRLPEERRPEMCYATGGASSLLLRMVKAPSTKGDDVYYYQIPSYGALDAWDSFIGDQQEEAELHGRLSSTTIGKKKDVAVAAETGDDLVDPFGIWSPGSLCFEPINLLKNLKDDGVLSDLQGHQDPDVCRKPFETATQVVGAFSRDKTEVIEGFLGSQEGNFDQWDLATPSVSPKAVLPNSPSGFYVPTQRNGLFINGYNLQYLTSLRTPGGSDVCTCEDSFIIQGTELCGVGRNKGRELQKERDRAIVGGRLSFRVALLTAGHPRIRRPCCLPFESVMGLRGSIAFVAKDQRGCRFLQRKLDEGTVRDKEMIYNEIIDHVPELMVDPFGNYLMQKVLDVCTEEQRLEIILALVKVPNELVRISLNMHGSRAVQKLIEVLQNKKETALVISALQPGFLYLVKDPNGCHVILRCLEYFSSKQSKFIFEAAVRHCVDIATRRHGSCVLQRCIAHSTGQHQARLLAEVSQNGLILAQNAFGNYAVQYILNMENPLVFENLESEFRGNYVQLSVHKFSSNVVQKCLRVFDEAGRRMIISELLSVACFDQLMQDRYANYVIQSALLVCKGHVRASLIDAICAHAILRANPYCKGIFNLLKE